MGGGFLESGNGKVVPPIMPSPLLLLLVLARFGGIMLGWLVVCLLLRLDNYSLFMCAFSDFPGLVKSEKIDRTKLQTSPNITI